MWQGAAELCHEMGDLIIGSCESKEKVFALFLIYQQICLIVRELAKILEDTSHPSIKQIGKDLVVGGEKFQQPNLTAAEPLQTANKNTKINDIYFADASQQSTVEIATKAQQKGSIIYFSDGTVLHVHNV